MLVIRESQINALEHVQDHLIVTRTLQWVLDNLPDSCGYMNPENLPQQVETAVEKARSYGIFEEVNLTQYLDLCCRLGFDFDENKEFPWAAKILNSSECNGAKKMYQLRRRVKAAGLLGRMDN